MNAFLIGRWPATALSRYFALLSFVVITLITVALSAVISMVAKTDLLEREWASTADFIGTEARQQLTAQDFAAPGTAAAQAAFRRFYAQTVMMPEILRVKIYDGTMRVVWSDEPRLIGQRFQDNAELIAALAGRTSVNLERTTKGENIYERARPQLVEIYVPVVFPEHPAVVGVVETYKDPARVFASIRRARITVAATALAGGALLYLSLFWVVRLAARHIEAQHRSLEERSRELSSANEELRAIQAQLVATERMAAIGEVVTAVAHGIRNPLANIRASAQVALLDCAACTTSPAPVKNLRNVIAEVDRIGDRVKELLNFVRPTETRHQPLYLNRTLADALRFVSPRLIENRITVDRKCAPALPVIAGDPVLIEHVLVNLLSNAVEATPPGGTIGVVTGVTGDGPLVGVFAEVRDAGRGIGPEELPKIFDLFYTTKAQGTGVGLAVAKKFAEAHGGTLTVESHPGDGATFRLSLPVTLRS